MIGIDWGTSSFRAYRLNDAGAVLDRREVPRGIMHVEGGRFADALRDAVGDWIAAGERRVLMCGMIGSRQGWVEAAYLPCPLDAAGIAGSLARVPFDGAAVRIVPGLTDTDPTGVPEVMRGEETKILGALDAIGAAGIACLPGTHPKWARVANGRVLGFATSMTGEMFAALRGHTILGRMMRDGAPPDEEAFDRGLARSAEAGGLLHHLFGVRTLGLFGALGEDAAASFLSGLLIGHEVRAAMPAGARVHLLGAPALCAPYARAIAACGGTTTPGDPEAAARGLHLIGARAEWT